MYFSGVKSQSINQKDIGAFYGVNRTNRINDYQLSDCKNMDCESFPYFATRRQRELFYNEKMAAICGDTDVENEYKVTGVTEDGGFVYRGEKVIDSGLSVRNSVAEYLGDYVMLPEKKYVCVSTSLEGRSAAVYDFPQPVADVRCEYCIPSVKADSFTPSLGEYFTVTSDKIYCNIDTTNRSYVRGECRTFIDSFRPGMFFKLKLLARTGYPDADKFTEYVCDIPDDVYMVIDDMYIDIYNNSVHTYYHYGDEEFTSDTFEYIPGSYNGFYITFTARRESTGELYDISKHFKQYFFDGSYTVKPAENFVTGGAGQKFSPIVCYWNDLHILPEFPVMLGGVHYNGRFFAYDNMGVDIYYSSGSGIAEEKYDFTPGTSAGGAGFVSCSDHGKWTALIPYGGALYAFKKNGMYRIYSTDGLSFYMDKLCDVGAVADKAVCVVSDVMYFLSENGLYKFTGSYPQQLATNLGRTYTHGVLGGIDNKLYASLTYSGADELVVYDAQVDAYGVHDDFGVRDFVAYGGELYALSEDGLVYRFADNKEAVEFELMTRKFFLSFEKKAINALRLYFDFSGAENEKIEVFVSYDNGEWEPCFKPITSGKVKYVPIKFKKCDELCVKIKGNGIFTLKGMTMSFYSGGDVKQNR